MHSKTIINVRYAETDKMGIVHHANYPVWFEDGRSDLLKMFDFTYKQMEDNGVMTPLRNLNCTYIKPALYPDKLLLRTWVINLTAARIEFRYTLSKTNEKGQEEEISYGTTEHAFVSTETFRPVNLKKKLPKLYEDIKKTL